MEEPRPGDQAKQEVEHEARQVDREGPGLTEEEADAIEESRIVQEHEGFHHGERVVILTDRFEDEGVSADEEGSLYISEVGAEEYNNVAIKMGFIPDGSDEPIGIELRPEMSGEDFESITL